MLLFHFKISFEWMVGNHKIHWIRNTLLQKKNIWEKKKIIQNMCHLGGYTLIKRINPRQICMRKEEIMETQCGFCTMLILLDFMLLSRQHKWAVEHKTRLENHCVSASLCSEGVTNMVPTRLQKTNLSSWKIQRPGTVQIHIKC